MKKSEEIALKCNSLIEDLNKCLRESGLKGRYLFWCSSQSKRLSFFSKEGNIIKKHLNIGSTFIKIKMPKTIPNIEDSFDKLENYLNVTERYYKQLYYIHKQGPQSEHHCVLVHSNKICLIALALSHPIIKEKKKIIKLDFQISDKVDRLENKVSGKAKKGGQHIMPDSALCFAQCEDGFKYTIRGCIKGKLIEINQSLLKNPNLLIEKPLSVGFIAIILPSIKDLENYKNKLLTQEEYESEILSCSTVTNSSVT